MGGAANSRSEGRRSEGAGVVPTQAAAKPDATREEPKEGSGPAKKKETKEGPCGLPAKCTIL